MNTFEIYTDGSAKNNGREGSIGGWAYLVLKNGETYCVGSGAEYNATNNQMELTAALRAIGSLTNTTTNIIPLAEEDEIVVYSDSAYLVNCWKEKWYVNWEKNGWINSKKEKVLNRELWEELIPFFKNPQIFFMKVKGHSTNTHNNEVDAMAQHAAEELRKNDSSNYPGL